LVDEKIVARLRIKNLNFGKENGRWDG